MLAPCGNRRATVCPACSDRYAADAYHLLRAGLAGDDTKHVPATVAEHPRVFLTLTAPSFGPVHTRALTPRGHVIPCRCGERHHPDDPRIGTALDPDSYDYAGRGAVAGPRRDAVGPVHHRPTPRPGRRARGQRCGVPRACSAVLRQGRRVPTPRARALPRRHPPRRPGRTRRPTTGRARPRRAARRDHRRRARRDSDHAPARRDTAGARLGRSAGPARGHRDRSAADRGRARRDHRRRPGRVHRQVRHQRHRRHTKAPTGRSRTSPTSNTCVSATTTAA